MKPGEGNDPERTRRIQEEIRRKIAERRGQAQPPRLPSLQTERPVAPPVMAPRPVASPMGGLREVLERKLAQARAQQAAAGDERRRRERAETAANEREAETERQAVLARQAELAAATRKAEEAKRRSAVAAAGLAKTWREELRNPATLRRAIVLREILDPPVSLR